MQKLVIALQPILAGLALDLVDFVTIGPLGLTAGLALGGIAGWVLAPSFGVQGSGRWVSAVLGAIYCAMPGTNALPLASLLAALSRLTSDPEPPIEPAETSKGRAGARRLSDEDVSDAVYRPYRPGEDDGPDGGQDGESR